MKQRSRLACTAFEEFMLEQDFPTFPCVICLRMALTGQLQRHHFAHAVEWMTESNPLFRSRIVRNWQGKHSWEIQPKADHSIEWLQSEGEPIWPETKAIDLVSKTGLLIEAIEVGKSSTSCRSVVFMQFHHAVVDGLGIMNAVHEMWLYYDALCNGRAVPCWDRIPHKLSQRNDFGLSFRRLIKLIPKQGIGLLGVRQYVMRNPKPLVDMADPAKFALAEERIHAISFRLTREESEGLRQAARVRGQTVNDLVAGIVFEGCLELRRRQPSHQNTEWLRMMVPISMRGSEEYRLQTACNIVSCVFLDRTPVQIQDRAALLASVHAELELIKRNRLGFIFLFSIWLKKTLSIGGSRSSHPLPRRCQTSVVFTNLGRVLSDGRTDMHRLIVGGTTIESVEILAPLNPWMTVAFIALQYVGELQLTLRYDSRCVAQSDAQELLEHCMYQLRQIPERTRGPA
ncbi:MAG: hypothetical protein ABL921_16665 [Pirellula sp.]